MGNCFGIIRYGPEQQIKLEQEQLQWTIPSATRPPLILVHRNHTFIKNADKDTDPDSQKLLDTRLQFDISDNIQARSKILLVCYAPQDVSSKWAHAELA